MKNTKVSIQRCLRAMLANLWILGAFLISTTDTRNQRIKNTKVSIQRGLGAMLANWLTRFDWRPYRHLSFRQTEKSWKMTNTGYWVHSW